MARSRLLAAALALAWPLAAQPDATEIIRRAAANAKSSLELRLNYTFTRRTETRHRDSSGNLKSTDIAISQVVFLYGGFVDKPISFNGGAPTAKQIRAYNETVAKVKSNPSGERARYRARQLEEVDFIDEVRDAMRYRLLREENSNGRAAFVIEGTPLPDYRPRTKGGKFLSKVKALIWVDQQDFHCIRVDASVTEACAIGTAFAKVQPGSRVIMDQAPVSQGLWMPGRIELKAEARILFFLGTTIDNTITYSDYAPSQPAGGEAGR